MKTRPAINTIAATALFITPATAAIAIVGVDFENAAGTAYDNTPDDLIAGDGITVSAWTIGTTSSVQNLEGRDLGANADTAFQGTQVGRVDARITDAPNFFTITIDDQTTVSLANITFAYRGATNAFSSRQLILTASVGGGAPISLYTSDSGGKSLIGRTDALNWAGARIPDISLSDAAFQNLTDTAVQFRWNTAVGGIDIDGIVINAIPEPSAALLGGLGMLALLRRRR